MTQELLDNIRDYLLPGTSKPNATSLIRFHNSKLSQIGDISFPLKSDIWENYLKIPLDSKEGNILSVKADDEIHSVEDLQARSQSWRFPLAEVKVINDRCALHLNRRRVMEAFLHQVLLTDNFGALPKDPEKLVRILRRDDSADSEPLTEYRARLVSRTLQKMLKLSEWTEVEGGDEAAAKTIHIVSAGTKAPKRGEDEAVTMIKCGTVLDPQTGKLARISADDYIKQRSVDMRLMAMHKYGIRDKDDKKLCELFERLGKAAVTVDLLEVKPSSPVSIIRSGQGSTKGASFILYNSARLETLLRSFDERVENGTYEKLPPLANIDVDLLNSEEEWELVYGYIFAFPTLIQRCVGNLDTGSCGVHHLIKYLDGLVSTFSVYYRRIRILTEKRPHLMPHVYARIYLLKAIRRVFNVALELLDIQPVQFM